MLLCSKGMERRLFTRAKRLTVRRPLQMLFFGPAKFDATQAAVGHAFRAVFRAIGSALFYSPEGMSNGRHG
jgi:hypothetical protein